ncbi:DUF1289 domain-containing protein [Utexia brackfieldae]|uniref:DUF1289 domain-containing protein n=1 Tax=Utexia brackfieldae TaxID=3074108 RepID=UPI00370D09C7
MQPNQIEFFDIPSPCRRVCESDKQGYCLACQRSREERFNWLSYNDEQKREILRLCRQRELRKKYLYLQQQKAMLAQLVEHSDDDQLGLF